MMKQPHGNSETAQCASIRRSVSKEHAMATVISTTIYGLGEAKCAVAQHAHAMLQTPFPSFHARKATTREAHESIKFLADVEAGAPPKSAPMLLA